MHILFITPRYHNNHHAWVKNLQSLGHTVSFIVSSKSPFKEDYSLLEPDQVQQKPMSSITRLLFSAFFALRGKKMRTALLLAPDPVDLKKRILTHAPDVIIVRDALSLLALTAYRIAKKNNIPAIRYDQYPVESTPSVLVRLFESCGLVSRQRISPVTTHPDRSPQDTERVSYIPLPPPTEPTIKELPNDDILSILFVGKFTLPRKHHLRLLEAITLLPDRIPVHVTMCGEHLPEKDHHFQNVLSYISDHDLEKIVTIKTDLPYREMLKLYETSDLFVLPSEDEPYAIAVLEALSVGLPVIISTGNGAQHVFTDGVEGRIIESQSAADWALAIERLYDSPDLLRRMSIAATTLIKTEYTDEVVQTSFTRLLQRIN